MREKRTTVWKLKPKDRPHYQLQWEDETGRRLSRTTGTADAKEAEKARTDVEYELNHGRYAEASRMTWDRFRERFEEEYVNGWRRNTQLNYQRTLDLFEEICGPKRVASIDQKTVSLFVAGMRRYRVRRAKVDGSNQTGSRRLPEAKQGQIGFNPSTIRSRLQLLHAVLTWAVKQKALEKVPEFPTVKVPDKDPQPVPAESFERLLGKAVDVQMRTFLLCGWLAGLRLSEAFYLEREETEKAPWIDLARNRIMFPAEFVKAARDQWVPLDSELRKALAAVPYHGKRVFRFLDFQGKPIQPDAVSTRVRALARLAGVRMTTHSLRKGFGCRYAAQVSAHVLQKLMRHANIKTTMKFYANIDTAVEEAVLGRLPNVLLNKPGSPEQGSEQVYDANLLREKKSGDDSLA
jgi:integrase